MSHCNTYIITCVMYWEIRERNSSLWKTGRRAVFSACIASSQQRPRQSLKSFKLSILWKIGVWGRTLKKRKRKKHSITLTSLFGDIDIFWNFSSHLNKMDLQTNSETDKFVTSSMIAFINQHIESSYLRYVTFVNDIYLLKIHA